MNPAACVCHHEIVFVFAIVLLLSGCVRDCETFKRFDFEVQPDAIVTRQGVPDIDGLQGVEPFPLTVSFVRQNYTLSAAIVEHGPDSAVRFSATTGAGVVLSLSPRKLTGAAHGCTVMTGNADRSSKTLTFTWVGSEGCARTGVLDFDVSDSNGVLMLVEQIQYRIAENGRHCVIDSI